MHMLLLTFSFVVTSSWALIVLHFRYGASFKTVAGKSKSVTKELTAPLTETSLPTILSQYALKDIFRAGEFGLFYHSLPSKTLHFKGQKCSGGKHSKVHLKLVSAIFIKYLFFHEMIALQKQ